MAYNPTPLWWLCNSYKPRQRHQATAIFVLLVERRFTGNTMKTALSVLKVYNRITLWFSNPTLACAFRRLMSILPRNSCVHTGHHSKDMEPIWIVIGWQ